MDWLKVVQDLEKSADEACAEKERIAGTMPHAAGALLAAEWVLRSMSSALLAARFGPPPA